MNVLKCLRRSALAAICVMAFGAAAFGQSENLAQVPAIGLETGQTAPAFALQDQLGQEQTIESLRGANGTVLLFVRSADW